jgi:hypothetical protein
MWMGVYVLHVDGWLQHVVSAAYVPSQTCTGDMDSGFFRAKLVADYSVAPNREDKLNVEVLAHPTHGCNCMINCTPRFISPTCNLCKAAAKDANDTRLAVHVPAVH